MKTNTTFGVKTDTKFLQTTTFLNPKYVFLGDLKPHAKFQNPMITPSGRKVSEAEERKKVRKRKNAVNSGHLVP